MTEPATKNSTITDWPDSLDTALMHAQLEFPDIPKDKINKFYDNQRYSSLDSIVSTTRPSLAKFGLVANHRIDDTADGIRVTAVLKYLPTKEEMSNSLSCGCDRSNPQKMGSAITYLRRYTIAPLLGVTPDEDDDGNAAIPEKTKPAANQQRSAPPATCRGTAQPNLSMPPGWPDTEVVDLVKWINGLAPTTTAFKTAWGVLKSNAALYSCVEDWELVFKALTDRLRSLIRSGKIPAEQRIAAFEAEIKAEVDRITTDKATAAAFID